MARRALERHLCRGPDGGDDTGIDRTTERRGVFVTLRNSGRLRGCIGTFDPDADLPALVARMAVAALNDSRFAALPISAGELGEIRIELSVLSERRRVSDPLSLELGVHGIYISRGGRSGCYLPQVSTEQGWDKETFLSRCCQQKADLPADAWRHSDTDVYLFSVEKFVEA